MYSANLLATELRVDEDIECKGELRRAVVRCIVWDDLIWIALAF